MCITVCDGRYSQIKWTSIYKRQDFNLVQDCAPKEWKYKWVFKLFLVFVQPQKIGDLCFTKS
jgi:hypothetical protein